MPASLGFVIGDLQLKMKKGEQEGEGGEEENRRLLNNIQAYVSAYAYIYLGSAF
jgi:hypothetical protein